MSKVFVVNQAGHDISPIRTLLPDAEVVCLSEGSINVFNTDRVMRDFGVRLVESGPGDYLLLSGSIAINLLAFAIMFERHGQCNLLIWHAREMRYVPRTIKREDAGYHGQDGY